MAVSGLKNGSLCGAAREVGGPEATQAVGIERCRALNESAERLLCYDTLFPRVPAASGGSAPQPVPVRPPDRSTDEGLDTPTASSHAPEDAIRTFGLRRGNARRGVSVTERVSAR